MFVLVPVHRVVNEPRHIVKIITAAQFNIDVFPRREVMV
jgi:hypothetical protein